MSLIATALAFILVTDGGLSDAGVSDRPVVTRLSDGSLVFSPAAVKAVDDEMKRLQNFEAQTKTAEAEKKSDPGWFQIVMISAAVGLAVGLPTGFLLGRALPKTP